MQVDLSVVVSLHTVFGAAFSSTGYSTVGGRHFRSHFTLGFHCFSIQKLLETANSIHTLNQWF